MTNLASLVEQVEAFPDATPAQHAATRAIVARHAPDLLDAIFGSDR